MVFNSRRTRADAFLISLSASGCNLSNGVYLHDDSYQQKADSAQSDFEKIDLTSHFNEQFTRVTSYDNDEDHAVAQLQVASRNQQLFIQLPTWAATSDSHDETRAVPPRPAPRMRCSAPKAVRSNVRKDPSRRTGHENLTKEQQKVIREALYLAPNDALALEAARSELALNLDASRKAGGVNSVTSCSPTALLIKTRRPALPTTPIKGTPVFPAANFGQLSTEPPAVHNGAER